MQTPDAIAQDLLRMIEPGTRERLVARGLARGMIWRGGILSEESPKFAKSLTSDLLDHGYLVLATSLRLRDAAGDSDVVRDGFRVAAESIESAVRRADSNTERRGENLVVAAAAFHLARLGARSYSLLSRRQDTERLSVAYVALTTLMRRDMNGLADLVRNWLDEPEHTDTWVASAMEVSYQDREIAEADAATDENETSGFGVDDAILIALTRRLLRGIARFIYALRTGEETSFELASETLRSAEIAAAEARFVSVWWAASLTRHLVEELWGDSLHKRLPTDHDPDPDGGKDPATSFNVLRRRFIQVLGCREPAEIDLWPSQHEAAQRSLDRKDDLVVALPTSAGKTRIAELCILRALSAGERVVYVTPLRALSAQIERGLGKAFRPLGYSVSSLYGASGVTVADVAALRSAAIVVSTPEKLDFSIRQDPTLLDDVGLIILDEGHMIGEGERELRYEVLVQRLLRRADANERRLVCLSAIFEAGESFDDFTRWLRSDMAGEPVSSKWRPTRQRSGVLQWNGKSGRLDLDVDGEKPFVPHFVRELPAKGGRTYGYPKNAQELVVAATLALVRDGHRVLVYCPLKKSVEAHATMWMNLLKQGYVESLLADSAPVERALETAREWLGDAHVATRALQIGIGVHHGSLPRPFLSEIERLLNDRVLPVVIASPTVAQGLDLSCSALVLQSIHRAGTRLKAGEYANVIGRAGRAFVDLDGLTIYPIYDRGYKGAWKRSEFEILRGESRSMESGIVCLIRDLAQMLGARLGVPWHAVLSHAADMAVPWEKLTEPPEEVIVDEKKAKEAHEAREKAAQHLADLDTLVLSTVETLDCSEEQLAAALDEALTSSLYRRRVERYGKLMQEVQEGLLVARARWLWSRSTADERRAWFSSGIGYLAGRYLNDRLPELTLHLAACDEALATGDILRATEALQALAGVLLVVHPFSHKTLHPLWSEVLAGWISGEPTSTLVKHYSSECLDTIQQAFVYRLVWGVEAIRVQAASMGVPGADRVSGSAALALTYGLPSRQACLLAQAGLVSRSMALSVLERFPGNFTTHSELASWLEIVGADATSIWQDRPSREAWQDLVASVTAAANSRWSETRKTERVTWLSAVEPPPAGEPIQLVLDRVSGNIGIYDTALQRLGELTESDSFRARGHITATVGRFPNTVDILRYGPQIIQ